MLSGQIEAKVSKKFQVAFPKRFRDVLGDEVIITKSIDRCLMIVGRESIQTLLEGTDGKPFTDKTTREMQRYIFGNAVELTLDEQGRFVLPEFLRVYAHIQKDVVFVGIERYVELWDQNMWIEHQKRIETSVDLLTINLSKSSGHE